MDGLTNGDKTAPGLFERGGVPGPGRPRGSRSRLAKALDGLAADDAEAVYATVKNLALSGDLPACREILNRAWPAPKGRAIEIELPTVSGVSELPGIVATLLQAVASGELIPSEAQEFAAVIEAYRKVVELSDVERRLSVLERKS